MSTPAPAPVVRRFRLTGRPAQLLAAVNALVALVAGFVPAFTATEAGSINAAAAAVLGLVAVWSVRPFPVTAVIAVVNTGSAVVVAFVPALHFTQGQLGLVDAAIAALLGLLLHEKGSPRSHA